MRSVGRNWLLFEPVRRCVKNVDHILRAHLPIILPSAVNVTLEGAPVNQPEAICTIDVPIRFI
jgi:hypothetical protein